ncbi:MAG: hypothetical protein ACRD96_20445, partial [Bryobacteraceae bacterium]
MRRIAFLLMLPALLAQDKSTEWKKGHSLHGEAFDAGPRQKPWVIEGIGATHFAITTANPEVQKWFDQGHTLLHSFWHYEAERAFRWCLKLEPDNAMAYWGLARAVQDNDRGAAMMREALKRKGKVSERERLYLEAWAPLYDRDEPYAKREKEHHRLLEQLCVKYPDDLEARSLLGLANMGTNRVGTDLILRQVIAQSPRHPGAHHYRIHNWNDNAPESALDSSEAFGKIASGIGHAQHMPGHIYSTVGMWHEAAISMDSATRVEKEYMRRRMAFPFNTWNYGHNANYLGYILEQLGMAGAAIGGARQLLDAPLDPLYNNPEKAGFGAHMQGTLAMLRVLVKFERWKELLDEKTFSWRDSTADKVFKSYAETLAHLG